MSDNLRHWSALSKTDPKHTKPFQRAGGFRGTATKPIWTEYRLTEHFGPCGVGWGTEQPLFTLVPAGDEILVFCSLQCWYTENGTPHIVWGVGGDKVLVKHSSGLRTDDEAYKKAFTDALGNAFKHVGSGADVHMGMFEDSKYVRDVAAEFAEGAQTTAPAPASERSAAPASQRPANGTARQAPAASRGAMPPVNPEEPPEVGEARAELKRLIREFRAALTVEAISDPKRGIWARNPETVAKIKKYGGDAAIDKLNEEAQKRTDELRQADTPV